MREPWPALPYDEWSETCDTLHLWTQIVGKVKLALCPFLNEYWQVAFRLTARGMTTGPIPYRGRSFEITFDFIDHNLFLQTSDGQVKALALTSRPVADFYVDFMDVLAAAGIEVKINTMPTEVPDPISCELDRVHASYDPEYVGRWAQVLLQTERVLERFRSGFAGKSSPIHFFWGSFDLAHTRFSGRRAPLLQGVPRFMQVSEDQENFSCGFWPGNPTAAGVRLGQAAFYAYAYPEPAGFREEPLQPEGAYYDGRLGQPILPYDAVRAGEDPEATLLTFYEHVYEMAARLGRWDRDLLEARRPIALQRAPSRST
ncbi:MAG TPA: DUF5996 family protein [Candidatus Dormibacteraeota bacterium]|nr:DUF5996 family protein [Candidatus Dormibacteraeota bacterium]